MTTKSRQDDPTIIIVASQKKIAKYKKKVPPEVLILAPQSSIVGVRVNAIHVIGSCDRGKNERWFKSEIKSRLRHGGFVRRHREQTPLGSVIQNAHRNCAA